MNKCIINIKTLFQNYDKTVSMVKGQEMKSLPSVNNAFILIEDNTIKEVGVMNSSNKSQKREDDCEIIDATDRFVFPAWCDSHTHLVFAESREHEFVAQIKGLSYEEIAKRGGGILNSAKKLQQMSEDDLFEKALSRVYEIIGYGTGAAEIKSGYGLTFDDEIKMLRVIKRLKDSTPLTIKSTFLGAHAVPQEYKGKQKEYVRLVIDEMLPKVADGKLADYVDVFCDKGFFSVEETSEILEAAAKYGLKPKIHANQLDFSGGVQVGVKYNAISVDHLEKTGEDEIEVLKNSNTMPTLLPNVSFYLGIPYAPARKMIDSGLPVVLASDYNPGSSPSGNMQFVVSLACIKYKMLPEEAINAATINGAKSMELENILGSITPGKIANLFITKPISSLAFFPYSFGENKVETVILNGKVVVSNK